MAEDAFQRNGFGCLDPLEEKSHEVIRHTEASHAGIDFYMYRERSRRGVLLVQRCLERTDLPPLPYRGRKLVVNDVILLAAPKTGHQQDAAGEARLAPV